LINLQEQIGSLTTTFENNNYRYAYTEASWLEAGFHIVQNCHWSCYNLIAGLYMQVAVQIIAASANDAMYL